MVAAGRPARAVGERPGESVRCLLRATSAEERSKNGHNGPLIGGGEFGSTSSGSAVCFRAVRCSSGWVDIAGTSIGTAIAGAKVGDREALRVANAGDMHALEGTVAAKLVEDEQGVNAPGPACAIRDGAAHQLWIWCAGCVISLESRSLWRCATAPSS